MNKKQCQYQSPYCQGKGEYEHTLKLGKVQISKQRVCGKCKAYLQRKEANN